MNQDDDQDELEAKRGKNGLPANLDKLKNQLEQLATARQASSPDDPKDVVPRFGGL